MSNHGEPSGRLPSSTGSVDVSSGNIFIFILHTLLFVLGVPGNCLIIRVYWSKSRQATSTTFLILALAWSDLAVCLLRLRRILEVLFLIGGQPVPKVIKVIWGFENIPAALSVLVTAVIAIDRYDCVCRPHSRLLGPRRAKMAVAASLSIALGMDIPALLSETMNIYTMLARFVVVGFQMLGFLMALVLIIVCYSLVYRAIRRHVRVGVGSSNAIDLRRQDNSKKQDDPQSFVRPSQPAALQEGVPPATSEEGPSTTEQQRSRQAGGGQQSQAQRGRAPSLQRKTTHMLFITSVVFLLTWLPFWLYICLELMTLLQGHEVSPVLMDVAFRSGATLFVNNVVNPLIYGIANRRFRKDCLEMLRKIRPC